MSEAQPREIKANPSSKFRSMFNRTWLDLLKKGREKGELEKDTEKGRKSRESFNKFLRGKRKELF